MIREEIIREVLRQNPNLYYRYRFTSAMLFLAILLLLFMYLFFV
jgi:hypothetical protein